MKGIKTEHLIVFSIASIGVFAFMLAGCGSDVTEAGGSEAEPEYLEIEYRAWTTYGNPAELNISYYLCDESLSRDTTFTGYTWSFELQAQSGDSLEVGCKATQGGLSTSVSIYVSGEKMVEENGLNPVARYTIP